MITIPSCDSNKTEDDLYSAFHLASTIRGIQCAQLVRDAVIARRTEKDKTERGGAFTKRLLKQIRGFVGKNPLDELDVARMVRFLNLSARGVYFYENFKPRKLSLRVASLDDDLADDPKESRALTIQRKSLNEEMAGSEYRGSRSNPDVFSYAICEKPEKDVTIIEMIFFWRAPPVVFLSSRRGTPDILTALTVIKMLCYVTARTFEGDKWPRSSD